MKWSAWCLVSFLAALAVPERALSQPAFLVEDLSTHGNYPSDPPDRLIGLGSTLVFVHNDGVHGPELWKSDGTGAGTELLVDLCPGICSFALGPFFLTVSNGLVFFIVDDGVHGPELWRSDGTVAGTRLVKDIFPGPGAPLSFVPWVVSSFLDVDGVLYFAADDGVHGRELWKSDGTETGTVLVEDVRPGPEGSDPQPWAAAGDVLLFVADDGTHGREPWVSDGTAAGTILIKDIQSGASSSIHPSTVNAPGREAIAAPGGGFLFQADDGSHGQELWKTDGTEAGTMLLKDIHIGSSEPSHLAAVGSTVYFSASDETNGRELWKTDGTEAGTSLVEDINPGDASSNPAEITASGSRIFFRALDGTHGNELWVSDGTGAGTFLVKDIFEGAPSGLAFPPNAITPFGGGILFFSIGDLWRSDGTEAGTVPVPGANYLRVGDDDNWAVAGSSFFFVTQGIFPEHHPELMVSDGSSSTLVPISPPAPWSLRPDISRLTGEDDFVDQGGRLLFMANPGVPGSFSGLWTSDATPAGTSLLSSLAGGGLTPAGGVTFLYQGFDLAKTDGTVAGTQVLTDDDDLSPAGGLEVLGSLVLYPCGLFNVLIQDSLCRSDGTPGGTGEITNLGSSITPFQLTASGGNVFFVAADPNQGGQELWKSDGTEAGTLLVRDIRIGGDSFPGHLTDVAGTLFFSAETEDEGRELWKSDGTEAGTVQVKDIRPGPGSSIRVAVEKLRFTAAVGGTLFFVADDGASGSELWKSDGTEAGTVRVKDIAPGAAGSYPLALTRVGGRVYFVAGDGVHGRELWVSDGTEAGTRMVRDIFPGEGSSTPQSLEAVGHILLFAATDGVHGLEAWRTNGTASGTRMIQDIAPAGLPSSPTSFTSAGSHVFFAANDAATGFEPWAVPRSDVLSTFADMPAGFWPWPFVEAVAAAGLTVGCAPDLFCPWHNVNRSEIAVFLTRGTRGPDFVPPPATGTLFADVPAGYWAAPWIEQFSLDGFTSGCGTAPLRYCPARELTRAEMAIFLLRAKYGSAYTPPPATGTVFTDIPAGHWAGSWIEQLAAEGITLGCAPGLYCPDNPVPRAQMAIFLTRTFSLPLP